MALRLQDKVAVITGASSGLGRAIAIRYAQEGAKVVCSDLTEKARSEKEGSITTHEQIVKDGGHAIFVQADVGDATQMENLVKAAVKEYGRLDMLVSKDVYPTGLVNPNLLFSMVNNAGISIEARTPAVLHLTEEATWDTTMRVNAKSIFLGSKYAITQMLAQEPHSSGDRGWMVNISSIMGMIAGPMNRRFKFISVIRDLLTRLPASYCASKGAVSQLTRQVALDYAPDKIHCNAICPGCKFLPIPSISLRRFLFKILTATEDTQTAIFQETTTHLTPFDVLQRRHPLKGPGFPDDIAKMAVVLASDDASWVTGVCLPVDGGYTVR